MNAIVIRNKKLGYLTAMPGDKGMSWFKRPTKAVFVSTETV